MQGWHFGGSRLPALGGQTVPSWGVYTSVFASFFALERYFPTTLITDYHPIWAVKSQ